MRAQRIKCPMGALTAEGVLIYDENVSGKRLGTSVLTPARSVRRRGTSGPTQSAVSASGTTAK
jgi:hypothetical protein